jgi:Icc protein
MILAQITDSHLLLPTDEHPAAGDRLDNLRAAVNRINTIEGGVDAVIHTGDMAHNHLPEEYALALEILSELTAPLYVVPGNRDSRRNLRHAFGGGYMDGNGDAPILYAIDIHAVRLVAFDSQSGRKQDTGDQGHQRKGDLDKQRLDWLDSTLAAAPDTPTAIFMHHPPVPIETSTYPWQWLRDEAGDELASVVSRHPQVLRLFCGHSHRAYMSDLAGVRVSTQPSIAVDLRLGEFAPEMQDRPVFQVHQFADGDFSSEMLIADTSAARHPHRSSTAAE